MSSELTSATFSIAKVIPLSDIDRTLDLNALFRPMLSLNLGEPWTTEKNAAVLAFISSPKLFNTATVSLFCL